MPDGNQTVAVRIHVPHTPHRIWFGILLLSATLFTAAGSLARGTLLVSDPILAFATVWAAGYFLARAQQVVSVEKGVLVVRRVGWVGPNITRQIGMDRVGDNRFVVREFARDRRGLFHRPLFAPRLLLSTQNGSRLVAVGEGLSLSEAYEVERMLNRMLESAGAGLDEPPRGLHDSDITL